MDDTKPRRDEVRRRNPRGQGERLREEIMSAAARLLEALADDQALSLRAVAREIGVAAPSVYIHFADRDDLVFAVMERCHTGLVADLDAAAARASGPVGRLRARALFHLEWALAHPGLYKVLHESTLNQRVDMPFKRELTERTTTAIQDCIDAGLAPPADAAVLALDLRTAIHGMASLRINQPDFPWPPAATQLDRFLAHLVGIAG